MCLMFFNDFEGVTFWHQEDILFTYLDVLLFGNFRVFVCHLNRFFLFRVLMYIGIGIGGFGARIEMNFCVFLLFESGTQMHL